MNKNLVISNHVSATLNYLVAIQNVFVTDECTNKHKPLKFPYMPRLKDHLKGSGEFLASFTDCWKSIVQERKSSEDNYDPLLANSENEKISLLFRKNDESVEAMRQSIDLFLSWWFQPYVGGNLLLDHVGSHTTGYLYSKLKEHLDRKYENYDVRCRLEVIYDELELFPELSYPESIEYVVISKGQLPDFRFEEDELKHKPKRINNLVEKLISVSGTCV